MIEITENRYDGVVIDSDSLPEDKDEFFAEIEFLIKTLRNKKLLWIRVPIDKSDFIPVLTHLGFEFHNCDEKHLMLVKKLTRDSFVPTTKNFIVGVGAIVINKGQLLVVKDQFAIGYKLPGGHVDKNESIKDALKREVYEETGIHVEFESIVNIGHFRNGQFGEANLYIVCTARMLSEEICINDLSEIIEARWIRCEDFLKSEEVNNYNRKVVEAALNNKELKLQDQPISLRVPNGEVFF